MDAEWMQNGCRMDAEWMQNGCMLTPCGLYRIIHNELHPVVVLHSYDITRHIDT